MSHTVVVIGFYGSKPRHVEKYATAWKDNVAGVKSVIASDCSGTLSLLTLGSYRDAKKIVEQIKNETHVVFHVLSNRGMWVYLEVVRMLPRTVKVDGVVFDSCPGVLSPWLFFKATAANEKNKKMKILHEMVPYLIFVAFSYRYGIVRSVLVHVFMEINTRIWTKLYHFYVARRDPAACPALFLYSKADELVTYDAVEGVIAQRQKSIGQVSRKRWETSPHVRHIYDFESEYVAELRKFAATIGMN